MTTNDAASRARLTARSIGTGAGLIGAALAPTATAATFTVSNLADAGVGSLRQAITDANAAAGADTIDFSTGLTGTITLTSGELAITDSVTIQGPGAASLSVSGNNTSRVFNAYNGSSVLDVTISGLTITNGNADRGGGIRNLDESLTLDGVVVSGNSATGDGGGLWADGFSMDLTVRSSTITGNTAGSDGGGAYIEDTGGGVLFENTVISNNQAADDGGGVYLYDPDTAVTFDRCTVSGNTASGFGGGVYLYDTDGGSLTFRDSTFSNNSAAQGGGLFLYGPDDPTQFVGVTVSGNAAIAGDGGGILLYSFYGGATLRQLTVVGNSATGTGGGVFVNTGIPALDGALIANNTAAGNPDLGNGGSASFAVRFSLIETPGTAAITDNGGNLLNQDPALGPLQDNGGPTFTHLPAAASPAVNAGDAAFAPPPASDQRARLRVADGRIDMGAVEVQRSLFTLDAATYGVAEDAATLAVTVSRSPASGPASIDIVTSNGSAAAGADYTAVSQTLSFTDGQASQVVNITVLDDALAEGDESFTIALANPSVEAALGATANATATIADVEGGVFAFSSATYTVDEDAGTLLITVSRSAGSTTAASIDYSSSSGGATGGADFTATSGTLNFSAGQTSASFSVPILDDNLAEGGEAFTLTLSNPTGGATLGALSSATASIVDVEGGSFALNAATYGTSETGGSLSITVNRSAGSTTAASVQYTTSDGSATAGADYTASSGTLNFAAGQASATVAVPILDDALAEGAETFTFALNNPTGGAVLGSPSSATATIADAESGSFSFSAATYSVDEDDGSLLVTVTRSAGTTSAASVDYATSNGSGTAGADYTPSSGTLNFAAGQTSATFSVPILDDALAEGSETFVLTLSNPGNGAVIGTPASATATITDVESGSFSLGSASYSVGEAGGSLNVTVNRSAGSTSAADISYATSDGTAIAGSDYTAASGTLSFVAGQTSASFSVPVLDDALVESSESFGVALSNPTGGATLGAPSSATASIVDNDVAGSLGFVVGSITVQENAGSVVIQVTRSGGSDSAVSLDFSTSDGSATAPADYAATSGTLNWPAGDSTARTITIPLVDDSLAENAETFSVTLSNPVGGATLGTSTVTITLPGNDQVVPPTVIPTLGDAGRLLLASLMALLAWVGLRRRRADSLLALLALGALLPGAADAGEPTRSRELANFEIASVAGSGKQLLLRRADGRTLAVDMSKLELRSPRGTGRTADATKDPKVGQIVLLRTDARGEGKQRAWLFDSLADAEAMLARKRARRAP